MNKSLSRETREINGYTETITYGYNREDLNKATGRLRGAHQHPAYKRTGMSSRRDDFESSTISLIKQLSLENNLALDFASKGFDTEAFMSEAAKHGIEHLTTGNAIRVDNEFKTGSSFSTRDLSPKLRHFINDYCRILELLTELVTRKIWQDGNIPASVYLRGGNTMKSLNNILHIAKKDCGLDISAISGDFFLDFYNDLWNDYKHDRRTADVSTSNWSTDNNSLASRPTIVVASSERFENMELIAFIDESITNLNTLLDYIA